MTLHTEITPPARLVSDPQGLRQRDGSAPRSGRIVVGVDGSASSLAALRRGIRIATAVNATLEIVTAWGYPDDFGATPTVDNWSPKHDAVEILSEAVSKLFPGELPEWISAHTLQGRAADVLIEAGRGAEMLIVGSRGHGGVVGLLLGSVSTRCAEHASCPVLVMH